MNIVCLKFTVITQQGFSLLVLNYCFQTTFPRQANGSCSNGAVKTFSLDSDDNERGVTFRVGKFIGQVTIESKLSVAPASGTARGDQQNQAQPSMRVPSAQKQNLAFTFSTRRLKYKSLESKTQELLDPDLYFSNRDRISLIRILDEHRSNREGS